MLTLLSVDIAAKDLAYQLAHDLKLWGWTQGWMWRMLMVASWWWAASVPLLVVKASLSSGGSRDALGLPGDAPAPLCFPCCAKTGIVGWQNLQCRWKWNLCNRKLVSCKLQEELSSLQGIWQSEQQHCKGSDYWVIAGYTDKIPWHHMTACVRELYNLLIFCTWTLFAGIILSDKVNLQAFLGKKK